MPSSISVPFFVGSEVLFPSEMLVSGLRPSLVWLGCTVSRVLCGEHTETTWPPPAPLCPGQDAAPCPVSTHQPSSPRHPRRARDPRGHGRRARHPAPSPDPRLPPPLCPPTVPPPCAGVRWPAFTRRFVSVVSGVVVAGCSECANNSSKHPPAQNQFNSDDTRGVGVSPGLWKL